MNKHIIEQAKAKIELKSREYADNFIAKAYQSQFDTPDAKKQVDSADHNMKLALETIEWLENFIKSHKPKTKK